MTAEVIVECQIDPTSLSCLMDSTYVRLSYIIDCDVVQEKDIMSGLKCADLQRCMGKYLGSRWRNMPEAEKKMYELLEASGATINPEKSSRRRNAVE